MGELDTRPNRGLPVIRDRAQSTLFPTGRREQLLVIYGVAFLAGCMIVGLFLGEVLGALIGVHTNVGGVGIAMLIMILLSDRLRKQGRLKPLTERGVLFWSSMYIPIVVAMAAKQNVVAAVEGGPAAILAGAGAVATGFLLVPVLSRIGRTEDEP
jgi:malonate transporter MadL subunit